MQLFSKRLSSLRKELGMTQAQLAKAVNIQRSTLSGYESENKEPNYETLCVLANYFGVTTDYMLGMSASRTRNDISFINDTNGFAERYAQLPADTQKIVVAAFDSFYQLMSSNVGRNSVEYAELYSKLFALIQSCRASIQSALRNNSRNTFAIASIMSEQNDFKNEVSVLLDQLMQLDMGVSTQGKSTESSAKNVG